METKKLFGKAWNFLEEEKSSKEGFGKLDFGILKTMLMLAAVDGDISPDEFNHFKLQARTCAGFTDEAFDGLWRDALHGAGYLALQAKFLTKDELAVEFVREVEQDFVKELLAEKPVKWTKVFDCLNDMATVDGVYSEKERACINALVKRVGQVCREAGKR